MKIGDKVRVIGVPPSTESLPEESQAVFRSCVGGVFEIIDEREIPGLGKQFVLRVNEVRRDEDHYDCDWIWIEPEFVEPA